MKSLRVIIIVLAVSVLASFASADEVPKTPAEFLKYFSFFTGEWQGITKSGNETQNESWLIQETPHKVCHLVFVSVDGEPGPRL